MAIGNHQAILSLCQFCKGSSAAGVPGVPRLVQKLGVPLHVHLGFPKPTLGSLFIPSP